MLGTLGILRPRFAVHSAEELGFKKPSALVPDAFPFPIASAAPTPTTFAQLEARIATLEAENDNLRNSVQILRETNQRLREFAGLL